VAARKAQQGTTTKPTSTAADGTPVYGQQDDSGPRNTAIKPPKPLEGVKGYA
jgi:hypothetical protein